MKLLGSATPALTVSWTGMLDWYLSTAAGPAE
jgi:hypothetical protein